MGEFFFLGFFVKFLREIIFFENFFSLEKNCVRKACGKLQFFAFKEICVKGLW
jgi:hypothetical protein